MPRVIIIGAGVGGLALAVYLAERGYAVTILERRATVGGRCGVLERGGYRFDLGATLLLMPRLCRSVFADWGEDFDAQLDLRPLDPIYTLYFEAAGRFAFSPDRERLRSELEKREPSAYERWQAYHALGRQQYREFMHRFMGRNFYDAHDYFTWSNLRWFVRLQAHRRHFALTRRYFDNPELQAAFTFQNIYVGQSPFTASAAYALLPALELEQGGWYPVGGMHAVVQRLVAFCGARNVSIRVNAEVTDILLKDGRAVGVIVGDGTPIVADVVVANADLPYVYRSLLPRSRAARRLQGRRYTNSAFVFHWGLRGRASELGHHNVFLARNYADGFDRIFGAPGSPPTHFYVNHPSATDPNCAPAGGDALSIVVPAPKYDARRALDWAALAAQTRALILARLADAGLGDVERDITFESCYRPDTWSQQLNLEHGSVFGSIDHGLDQVGYLRPANRHPHIGGLYFVGGSTHPGSGVPLVLLSARLTAERILRDAGVRAPFPRSVEF